MAGSDKIRHRHGPSPCEHTRLRPRCLQSGPKPVIQDTDHASNWTDDVLTEHLRTSVHPPETKAPPASQVPVSAVPGLDPCFGRTGLHGDSLSQVFRHSGWAGHRRLVYQSLVRLNEPTSRIAGFSDCGFGAFILKSDGDPPRYRVAGSSCHDRFCTPCATERARTIAHNVLDRMGTDRVRFITLTLSHSIDELSCMVDKLYESFRTLQRTKLWRKHVTGGVSFLEIKRSSRSDHWHPHLHVLAQGSYVEKPLLQAAWHRITGDSFIVDVRLAGGRKNVTHYVTKYASKPLNTSFIHDRLWLDEAIRALKGRRLCATFGKWRGTKLLDNPSEEAWENLGSLTDWVLRAVRGDDDALYILNQIDTAKTAVCLELAPMLQRPPPPAPPKPKPVDPLLFEIKIHPWQMDTGRCT